MIKKFTFLGLVLSLVFGLSFNAFSQQQELPEWRLKKYLSEEEMYLPISTRSFVETPPPTGEVRFPGEYEPMQAVMIVYPLGIPVELVREMAEDCKVITVVTSYEQSSAESEFQSAGVNMDNVEFLNASTNSYWIRDFGPWYIFNGTEPAIVDNIYNRPRPHDDDLPGHFAEYWDIEMFGMKVVHTGGNMMEDGRGNGVSDDIVITESVAEGISEDEVYQRMKDYLGIDPYHVTIDPQGDYIAHVDCWGKYLAPDKILLARVPESHPRYPYYEEVANYFATTNCCWGYPYKIYRVDIPMNGIAPYTNSLILNKKVLVPMGSNNTYNQGAINIYQEAMPGYEIIGVENDSYWDGWLNTDALHCRTRGVMDFDMLYVDHRNVVFGEQEWHDSIAITSKFIAYSGADLKQDSLLIYYSIDGGEYQTAKMTATGNPDEYVGYIKGYQGKSKVDYYVFAADESGRRYQQPVFGELDPHTFTMEEHAKELLTLNPEEIIFDDTYSDDVPELLTITNNTVSDVVIENITIENSEYELDYEFTLPYTIAVGESVEVDVYFTIVFKNGLYDTEIVITSSVGEQIVPVKYTGGVSLDENNLVNVEIYPNPMNDVLTVKGDDIDDVSIFNAVGQEILTVENTNNIDVSALGSGLYFVKVTDRKGNVVVNKVVKE
ncbi:MAG: agmatine deiminase family protein [Bacteroidales bacterium]|nr:agmatine deiminase family protein [Bacteroidales bacterium]